jgi:hypothetical protein
MNMGCIIERIKMVHDKIFYRENFPSDDDTFEDIQIKIYYNPLIQNIIEQIEYEGLHYEDAFWFLAYMYSKTYNELSSKLILENYNKKGDTK